MILSQYRNPPYRSPTPKGPTSPPPGGPSPKRKRTDSDAPSSEGLDVQTNLRDELGDIVSGCDSPRSKMAERFKNLNLQRSSTDDDAGKVPVKRARLKRNSHVKAPSPEKERVIAETPDQRRRQPGNFTESIEEIQETPQVQRQPSSPLLEPEEALANFRRTSEGVRRDRSPTSTPLPPSPRVVLSPPPQEPVVPDRALSPLQLNEDLSLDQAALTWQDSEITGHEIDASQGDDGLGINGIGFRPTPAIAYARSMKRRQQVRDWKAREASEARQRRMDKRRGAGRRSGEGVGGVRRAVRFEGAG